MDGSVDPTIGKPVGSRGTSVKPQLCSEPIRGTHLGKRSYDRLETGHMTASDPLPASQKPLQVGGRPHMDPLDKPEGDVVCVCGGCRCSNAIPPPHKEEGFWYLIQLEPTLAHAF